MKARKKKRLFRKFSLPSFPLCVKDSITQLLVQQPYVQVVGNWMYAIVHTLFNCSYIVCSFAQFIFDYGEIRWQVTRHMLRYIKATLSLASNIKDKIMDTFYTGT
jgi:hypothetical protein